MAIKHGNRKQNLQSAMNIVSRTTGYIAKKGATLVTKSHADTVDYTVRNAKVMEAMQSSNHSIASLKLINRETAREQYQHQKLYIIGKPVTVFEVAAGWVVNHLIYVWDSLWGYIEPIIIFILMGIFRVVMITSLSILFIYMLFLLFTSSKQ
jgi:hypothetical protein